MKFAVTGVRDRLARCALSSGFSSLSLARKVALIPGLTLLLMGLMLAVAVRMGDRNTVSLRGLDNDVFEPLQSGADAEG